MYSQLAGCAFPGEEMQCTVSCTKEWKFTIQTEGTHKASCHQQSADGHALLLTCDALGSQSFYCLRKRLAYYWSHWRNLRSACSWRVRELGADSTDEYLQSLSWQRILLLRFFILCVLEPQELVQFWTIHVCAGKGTKLGPLQAQVFLASCHLSSPEHLEP